MNMPPGRERQVRRRSARPACPGTSRPRRSTRTSAAAYINWLIAGAGLGRADVRPEPDPGDPGRAGGQGQPVPDARSPTGWQQLVKANGLTLFPDWASDTMLPTMGAEFQKMMAGAPERADTRQDHPGRLDDVRQAASEEVSTASREAVDRGRPATEARPADRDSGRAGGAADHAAARRASRASSPTCTSCRGSRPTLLFTLFPLVQTVHLSFYQLGRAHPATWVGLDNYRADLGRPRDPLGVQALGRAGPVLAVVPILIGLLLTALLTRFRVHGFTVLPHGAVPAQTIATVVVAQAFVWIYDPVGPAQQAPAARSASALRARPGSATSPGP